MNFNQLNYFIVLSQEKNFTKAAQRLFITQPSLSIQIKELERELNQQLIIRDKKALILTKEGTKFLEFAKRTMHDLENTKTSFDMNMNDGHLTLGLYWMFGYNGIGKILHDFYQEFPFISCPLEVNGSRILLDKVVKGELDAAVITGNYHNSDSMFQTFNKSLMFSLLDESPLVLVTNINSELSKLDEVSLDQLDGKRLMHISKDSNLFHVVNQYFTDNNIHPRLIGYSSQADVCMQTAHFGLGYSFVTQDTINHYEVYDDIKAIPIVPTISRQLYFISKKDNPNHAVSIFREYLKNHF